MQQQNRTLDEGQRRAVELIRDARRFVLSGHVRPDGDCIGAEAALARALEQIGKEVWIINPDPPEPQFDYLARECNYRSYSGGDLPVHDVSVLLDASELSRCGELGEKLRHANSKKLVIDHHVHRGDEWWDEAFVDVTASATGLLVHRILRQLGVELDPVIASGVFTSIVTDTGWFKYSNTDDETLTTAGELIAAGVRPAEMFRAIYQRESSSHPHSVGRVLRTVEYHADGRLAVVRVAPPQAGEEALVDGDIVLDILRSVARVEVVVLLRQMAEGQCKLSARSKGDYDVQKLASRFGGGGHVKASGATIPGELDEAVNKIVAAALEEFELQEVSTS